jgi:hypothetical protein
MLDDDMKAKDVVKYLKKKIEFLENPVPGNRIEW